MDNPGKLKLNLTNVSGNALREDVDVELRHVTRGTELRVRLKSGKSTTIGNLVTQPDGIYRILVDPPSYLPVAQFVAIKPTGVTTLDLSFPVDPRKIKEVRADKF